MQSVCGEEIKWSRGHVFNIYTVMQQQDRFPPSKTLCALFTDSSGPTTFFRVSLHKYTCLYYAGTAISKWMGIVWKSKVLWSVFLVLCMLYVWVFQEVHFCNSLQFTVETNGQKAERRVDLFVFYGRFTAGKANPQINTPTHTANGPSGHHSLRFTRTK